MRDCVEMKLAGVVVFYNPDNNVATNVASYIKDLDVLYVVDNSLNDNSSLLQRHSSKIKYISNKRNLGIAKALNIAAKNAIEDGYDWLLTMDQDSRFEAKELKKMISFIKTNDTSRLGLISPWHKTKYNFLKPEVKVEKIITVMSSGNIVSLKAYKKVGGWKDWMFIDCVDFEFCMNLNIHDYEVLRLNYIELEHNLGDIKVKRVLFKKFILGNHNFKRRYYMVRNVLYLNRLYGKYYPEYCLRLQHYLIRSIKNIIIAENDKFRKILSMYRGYRDFKKGKTGEYDY